MGATLACKHSLPGAHQNEREKLAERALRELFAEGLIVFHRKRGTGPPLTAPNSCSTDRPLRRQSQGRVCAACHPKIRPSGLREPRLARPPFVSAGERLDPARRTSRVYTRTSPESRDTRRNLRDHPKPFGSLTTGRRIQLFDSVRHGLLTPSVCSWLGPFELSEGSLS